MAPLSKGVLPLDVSLMHARGTRARQSQDAVAAGDVDYGAPMTRI